MFLDAGHVQPPLIFFIHPVWLSIHQAFHRIIRTAWSTAISVIIVATVAAHAGPSASAATLTFIMPGQCIASGKPPTTFWTAVRSLPGMKLGMPFQVM